MFARSPRLICLLSCITYWLRPVGLAFAALMLLAAPLLAQEGHPAKGTWVGFWGPATTQQNRVVIVLDHDGKNLSGTVNPGPNGVPIKMARLDIVPGTPPPKPGDLVGEPTFKLRIEVDGKDAKGNAITIVADGTMEQVGLPNRMLAGTWTQTSGGKTEKGQFRIRLQ